MLGVSRSLTETLHCMIFLIEQVACIHTQNVFSPIC